MAASQLSLYNAALSLLREREIASLSEDVENRRVMDGIWNRGSGAIRAVLEQGLWNFATRTSKFDASNNIVVDFGFPYGFEIPSDFVRLMGIASDEFFTNPLTATDFVAEAGNWYANLTPIYVRYVSDGVDYGNNFAKWPETFCRFVEAYLAREAAPRLTKDDTEIKRAEDIYKKRLLDARSKDAMNEGTQFLPMGGWRRSRLGWGRSWRDGGNRNSLIG